MLLTETWLDHAKTVSTLIESAPPNFNFMSTTHEMKRGGGIAAIYKASFQSKLLLLGHFTYFQYLCSLIKHSPNMLLLTIYRPPRQSVIVFLDEFCELLSTTCLEFDSIIIAGDFSLHIDNSETTNARDFLDDTFSLTQHVQGPTH